MEKHAELFHSLEGNNIYFKSLSVKDVQEIHNYASDQEVSQFIGWNLMSTLEETRRYIEVMLKREAEGTHLYSSVVEKHTDAVIGTAMIFNFDNKANNAEVGYVLNKHHWGKGYGRELVALMSNFAFSSLQLHKLHAILVDANIGSARILEKNQYELEGRLKDHYFIENTYYDALLFGKILTSESSFC